MTFNFDEWAELYKKDPELFEKKRQEFLKEYIANQWPDDPDKRQRAEAQLWRMEQNYRHVKNDTERFNMVVAEFWKQVQKFQDALNSFDK
jgi:hypothetical protein